MERATKRIETYLFMFIVAKTFESLTVAAEVLKYCFSLGVPFQKQAYYILN